LITGKKGLDKLPIIKKNPWKKLFQGDKNQKYSNYLIINIHFIPELYSPPEQ